MNVQRAIEVIEREAKVLGLTFDEQVKAIDNAGAGVYTEYTIKALMTYKNSPAIFQPLSGFTKF
jgi:hypothetical protein